uniref:Uncharacterized protein n=1 Tax=Oryza punctata TaxID=4537 RepID=A0A0E0LMJ8_ORYPU
MLATSVTNSFIPCLDSCDTLFTAISMAGLRSTPRSAYLSRRLAMAYTAMATAATSAADAMGSTISSTFDRGFGQARGNGGSDEMFSGGAGPSSAKLQPSTKWREKRMPVADANPTYAVPVATSERSTLVCSSGFLGLAMPRGAMATVTSALPPS